MPDPNDQAFFYMRWNDSKQPLNADDDEETRMLAAEFHGDVPVDEEITSPSQSEIDSRTTARESTTPSMESMSYSRGQENVYITSWHNWPDGG